MSTKPLGDKCNTLLYRHKCHEEAGDDEEFDQLTVRELTVTECGSFPADLEVDTLTGIGGCDDPDNPSLSFLINASATIRDTHELFVQMIQEVNGPVQDPPRGTGVTIVGDIYNGALGERLNVKEIRDLDDINDPVFIPFIGTGLIDEAVNGAGIQVTGAHTQFFNPIKFGNPSGANFAYDKTTVLGVTMSPQDATAGVPVLNVGNIRYHRIGARNVTPMVTAIWGNSFVTMANAPFNFYRSSAGAIPAGYIPTQDFYAPIITYRGVAGARYSGVLIFRTSGVIDFLNQGDDQGIHEGWFNTDNTKTCGILPGSAHFEAVAT